VPASGSRGGGRLAAADLEPFLNTGRGKGSIEPGTTASGIGFGRDLTARSLDERRRELEREYLIRLFRDSRGDLRAMMRALRVKSSKLYAWFRDLGLDIRDLRKGIE
jgi:DNA-binding NtrC family response regulator